MPFYVEGRYCGHLNMLKVNDLIEQGILIKKGSTVIKA